MQWKRYLPMLVAALSFGLLATGCGPAAAPTAAEKPKYPPGQDPEVDYLPNNAATNKKAP